MPPGRSVPSRLTGAAATSMLAIADLLQAATVAAATTADTVFDPASLRAALRERLRDPTLAPTAAPAFVVTDPAVIRPALDRALRFIDLTRHSLPPRVSAPSAAQSPTTASRSAKVPACVRCKPNRRRVCATSGSGAHRQPARSGGNARSGLAARPAVHASGQGYRRAHDRPCLTATHQARD